MSGICVTNVAGVANSPILKEFTVSTVADILKLPTSTVRGTSEDDGMNGLVAPGSTALVVDTAEVYVLDPSSDTWKPL